MKQNLKILKSQEKKTECYPHFILFDFESYGDKNARKEATNMLTYQNVHVPISVSIGDTLNREPTHIRDKNPSELVKKFIKELKKRAIAIIKEVRKIFMPKDKNLLPKKQIDK